MIAPAEGRMAVMVAGLGPLGAIFIATCLLMRKETLARSAMTIRSPEFAASLTGGVPLAESIRSSGPAGWVFGGWDIYPDDLADVARTFGMVGSAQFEAIAGELRQIVPMPALFYPEYVPAINGTHVKHPRSRRRALEILMENMTGFIERNNCSRGAVVWCGSTETKPALGPGHETPAAFEAALDRSDPAISPSQIYAWAAVKLGMPFASGSPNQCLFPALVALANETGATLAGEVFRQRPFGTVPGGWESYLGEEPWTPPGTRDPIIHEAMVDVRSRMRIGQSRRTAPIVADVVALLDAARLAGFAGLQTWMDLLFQEPITPAQPGERVGQFAAFAQTLAQRFANGREG